MTFEIQRNRQRDLKGRRTGSTTLVSVPSSRVQSIIDNYGRNSPIKRKKIDVSVYESTPVMFELLKSILKGGKLSNLHVNLS